MPDYNKINLSNVKFEGDPFDVNEGVIPEEVPEPTFDPTNLPVSTNTPTDADEIMMGENGSWVRKTFAKIKEYFTTYVIGTGDNDGQIKITPSDGTAYNVDVKGLKSAAYLNADTAATANTVVKRNASGYIYGTYINQSSAEESSATNARPCIIDSSGWHRKFSIAAFRNLIGLGNTSSALPVANGGTGSNTAAGARTALGLTPVTLWTGSAGNASGAGSPSITLNQSYKNFRTLRFYCKTNYTNLGIESRRYIRDVSTQQINEIRNLGNDRYTIGIRWGWQAETEYFDILRTSTDTVLKCGCSLTVCYKIEGLQI